MSKVTDATLKMRLFNIKGEIPSYWRKMAIEIDNSSDLSVMHDTLRGKSHNPKAIETFERIVVKCRKMAEIEV